MPNVIIIKDVGVQGPPGPPGLSSSGFPYTGSAIISGSLAVTGSTISTQGFTGSLLGTASYSTQTLSSSYALTASYALFAENGGGGGGNGGFTFATIDDQLDLFSKTYLDGLTPTRIITGSINEPLTYTGQFQLFEIINVSRQLGLTLSAYGNVNMTSSININEDTDLTPGTYFSAPSGSYFSSITFNTTVGNQSIKVYEQIPEPRLLTDGLFTTSSVIVSKNLYVYENLEVFGIITGSLYGTASFAATASYALNANSQGSGFPFSGSAVITGSIEAGNTPFPIINNQVNYNQTSSLSIASISLEPKSNLVDEPYIDGSIRAIGSWYVTPSQIFVGSTFDIIISSIFGSGSYIGSRVLYTGSTDIFGIPGYRYVGDITGWRSATDSDGDSVTVLTVRSVTATVLNPVEYSDIDPSVDAFRVYPPSGSGVINLKAYVTASKGLLVTGPTRIIGSTAITGSLNITGSTNVRGTISASNYIGNGNTLSGIVANPMFEDLLVNANITATGSITGSKLLLTGNELNIGTTNTSSKSINLGQIETGLNQGGTTNRLDQNTITFNRNLNAGDTNIHTRINFNGRYWVYNPGPETYDVLADTNNHYLQFNSSISSSGNIIYNRFIDLQFHTQPTGSNVAKGFSTNYNGSTYFNVTGSVSASSYYGDGSNLTGLIVNPFIGSFITTGSLLVAGSTSINGSLLVTGSLRATGSIIVTGSVNSTEGVNGVFIGEGLGSRTTNLVIGDTRSLSTVSGTGTSGQNLIAIGSGSLISATTTFKNIALGNNVLPTITSNGSNNNIGIGFDVLTLGTTSLTNNIAIGNSASFGTTSGDNNIAIGSEALFSNTSQNNNIGIGLRAGRNATGAANSIFIGTDAAASLTSGDFNIAIGFEAFRFASSNSYNVAIGYQALVSGSGVTNCIAIGANALERATSGDFNVAIGFEALKLATTNSNNIAIGYQSLLNGSGVIDSIAIGANALRNTTTGDDNIGIGANALRDNAAGNGNLAIGTDSMITPSSTLASNNTAIGFQSLQLITGSNNLALGYRTMQSFRSGSNNTVVGYNSIIGAGISGSNNTIIGANVVLPDGVYNNRIIIADGQGNQRVSVSGSITSISGSLNVTGSSAIFTLQPLDPLPTVGIPTGSFAVSSSIPAKPYFWDGSVWNALY